MRRVALHASSLVVALACAPACVSYNPFEITVYGEPFIEEGIPADEVTDGHDIVFSRFLIALHDVRVRGASTDLLADGPKVVDLSIPTEGAGTVLDTLAVQSGQYTALDYTIAPLAEGTAAIGEASDVAALEAAGASMLVEGRATKGDVVTRFTWAFAPRVRHVCAIAQDVTGDALGKSEITIHADHLFYDSLTDDDPSLRFDLIASSDADGDGDVTLDELAATDIRGEEHYGTGSRPISDLRAYIEAQAETVGHIDGEGHCDSE